MERIEKVKQNQIKGFQSNYSELPRQQLTAGVLSLENHEVLVLNQHQWKQKGDQKRSNEQASFI